MMITMIIGIFIKICYKFVKICYSHFLYLLILIFIQEIKIFELIFFIYICT